MSDDQSNDDVMRLLGEGIPLTLLIDLATPPHSRELFREEPAETDWLVGVAS